MEVSGGIRWHSVAFGGVGCTAYDSQCAIRNALLKYAIEIRNFLLDCEQKNLAAKNEDGSRLKKS